MTNLQVMGSYCPVLAKSAVSPESPPSPAASTRSVYSVAFLPVNTYPVHPERLDKE